MVTTLILFTFSLSAQVTKHDTTFNSATTDNPVRLITLDTLRIQNIDSKGDEREWYLTHNMPWIIALAISLAGILVNVYITNRQIRANLSVNNRQEWINETRSSITDLLTQAKLLNSEFQEPQPDRQREKELHKSITLSRTKLLLQLKPTKPTHKALIDSLGKFISTLDEHLLNSKAKRSQGINIPFDNLKFSIQMTEVVDRGRDLLYEEWNKIQSVV